MRGKLCIIIIIIIIIIVIFASSVNLILKGINKCKMS